jgi:hypothetical protein
VAKRPDVERVKRKYDGHSTTELQLRRQQLHESIPDMVIKFGLFGPDFSKERQEKEEIEMELLRRFEAGDASAELKPLPTKSGTTLRGGNFWIDDLRCVAAMPARASWLQALRLARPPQLPCYRGWMRRVALSLNCSLSK